MRLLLRHPPPGHDAPLMRCAHLEALAQACVGVPLGPAARWLAGGGGRGRHGNALQWHFGLELHDSDTLLDWEDRIELKLVSVWRRADGSWACDKLKVCELGQDPWHKLSNVLWVFADRMSRVVLGARHFCLAGPARLRLADSWRRDPHFDSPALFVEARDGPQGSSPAYYLAASYFAEMGILPPEEPGFGYRFDASWWSAARKQGGGRSPLLAFPRGENAGRTRCPRCRGELLYDVERLRTHGWSEARHSMPIGQECAVRAHAVLDPARLPNPVGCSPQELVGGVEATVGAEQLWRLADRIPEPEDHMH